jgi:lysyl-tRNA synthetase class 2
MSTAVSEIDYDEAWETLTVRFTDGRVYKYWNVPAEVYAEFLYASSAGGYFNANIRDKYSYREG